MISRSHPRYASLKTRELLERGVAMGITSLGGLIAHGRGEAFDYLLGETTHDFAKQAIVQAATMLLYAKHPVISVNGNTTALVAKELVVLSKILNAPLEVNIFHPSKKREKKIYDYLIKHGAKDVFLSDPAFTILYLDSNRKFVNKNGIYKADIIFVPLEDGDRTEALIRNGKKVITIDLNPLSRTAQTATVTIVDNITRAMPCFIQEIKRQKSTQVKPQVKQYDNKEILKQAIQAIKNA